MDTNLNRRLRQAKISIIIIFLMIAFFEFLLIKILPWCIDKWSLKQYGNLVPCLAVILGLPIFCSMFLLGKWYYKLIRYDKIRIRKEIQSGVVLTKEEKNRVIVKEAVFFVLTVALFFGVLILCNWNEYGNLSLKSYIVIFCLSLMPNSVRHCLANLYHNRIVAEAQ